MDIAMSQGGSERTLTQMDETALDAPVAKIPITGA
jgi:hypothetical protein